MTQCDTDSYHIHNDYNKLLPIDYSFILLSEKNLRMM